MRKAAPVLLLLAAGCGRSCKNDHPYVPYSIGDDAGGAADDAGAEDAAAALGEEGGAPLAVGVAAPAGATRWPLDGLDLVAPPDRVLVLGLARDLDGDGQKDALAVARPTGSASGGELLFYKGGAAGLAPPERVAGAPFAAPEGESAPQGPVCTAADKLAMVGKSSIAVELGAECKPPLGGVRWLGVILFAPRPRVHFEAMVADPAGAPRLQVDVDGADRDGDGIDDVALRVTIDAPSAPFEPMPRVTAKVAWFDRPAGLSRDPDEPDASLRAIAQSAASRAARVKDAPAVPGVVHQVRALYAAMCAESAAPRLLKPQQAAGPAVGAVTCGPSRALEEAGMALVRASVTMGDPVRAAWALDHAQNAPATHTAARTTEASAWMAAAFPPSLPRQLRAISAVPLMERGTNAPAWGPLAFEPSGKLLVRTMAGVVRVDPQTGDEVEAPDVTPWRYAVVGPSGAERWTDTYASCDGVALHATFAPPQAGAGADAGGEGKDVLLPIAPPLGGHCAGKGEPVRGLAIAWGERGLEALVAGEPLLFAPDLARASLAASWLDEPGPRGSPRSPNGRALVVPTSQGIVVRAGKARVLRAKELDGGYGELQACTVSDDAQLVACVRGGRAFVGAWDAP